MCGLLWLPGRPAGWSPSPSGASYLPEEAPLPSRHLSIDLDTNAEFTFLWKNPPWGLSVGWGAEAPCPWVGPSPSAISGSGSRRKP